VRELIDPDKFYQVSSTLVTGGVGAIGENLRPYLLALHAQNIARKNGLQKHHEPWTRVDPLYNDLYYTNSQ
jgi:nucleoside-diphosphate-sugar epimerase